MTAPAGGTPAASGPDAVVVGPGPNGLAAAVVLARAGLKVQVLEAAAQPGGGSRTQELIEPGHWHDVCSAVHPMAVASPFFRDFGLDRRIRLHTPEVSYAQVIDGAEAAIAYRSLSRTAEGLGADGPAYRALIEPLVRGMDQVMALTMNQLLRLPRNPPAALRYGLRALEQGSPLWNTRFRESHAPALLAGVASHTPGGPRRPVAAGAGLMPGALAHTAGYPIPAGGSQTIIGALPAGLQAHGGSIATGVDVEALADLPAARAVLLDTPPQHLLRLAADRLPARYVRSLAGYRYGPGAAKVDYILSGPVPWANAELAKATTVHLGGTREQIRAAGQEVARGRHAAWPFTLVAQPSSFDPLRAPAGRHVLWTYSHVPHGSARDLTAVITAQLEQAALGFTDLVVASRSMGAADYSRYNANYVGGDFGTGAVTLRQVLARPVPAPRPWRTPLKGFYLCSAATPPGPGVHGMWGYHAARLALQEVFGLPVPPLAP
ncbi:NAD(P)/FAD-dependent oxidoreductase [Arthrobacter deserti]|uniref:NAD(P)/FAD-dependent oxidoreductase n=1 Tax=Arthrobacter deserti TaxID=1742687 RepID=A0ABX1JPZ8_9MICC|nr:NAD(P)/FAD-dependent oxidoreductase [Arthrobacter deserti]